MHKTLFDLPRTDAAFQIHDHGYWIRHQDNWWRAAWIQPEGRAWAVMYQTRPGTGFRFGGRFTSITDAEAHMKKLGRKAKGHG